jgi:tRNA threonylcarbamoyladenosine biosynthesis protein TsaE
MRIKPEDVQSPSFVLIREYRGPRLWLFHADFYRVGQEQAVRFLGLEEYVTPRGVLAIEWPCGMGQLTADYLDVRLRIASRTRRIISVRGRGLRPQALQRTLTQTVPRRTRVSA